MSKQESTPGTPQDDRRLLARAFSADAQDLTEDEAIRLRALLETHPTHAEVDTSDSVAPPEQSPGEESEPSRYRVPRRLLYSAVGVTIAVASFSAGFFVNQLAVRSPYLTADEVLAKTGQHIAFPLDVEAPAGFDAGSLYLSTQINGNDVWIGTREGGELTCFYVDTGIVDAPVEGCALTNAAVSGIGVTPDSPRLDPQDKGQYTLNIYEHALPFVSFRSADEG